jgi:hypothetical protein
VTGTITLTTDNTNERIGVQLNSWVSPANGSVTVYRVHSSDTSEWAVRALSTTSGGAAFAWDYEAPFGQSVTYYCFDGATKVTSSPTTLNVTYPLLRGPGLPSNDATFTLVKKPSPKRPRPGVVLQPLGRATSVAIRTARVKPSFALTVETHSDVEARALLNTVTQSPTCLLLIPGTRDDWQYVDIADIQETPFTEFLRSTDGDPGSWVQWQLDCTVVDPPVGGIFGDPTASYALITSSFATYTTFKAYGPYTNYLAVLKGYP